MASGNTNEKCWRPRRRCLPLMPTEGVGIVIIWVSLLPNSANPVASFGAADLDFGGIPSRRRDGGLPQVPRELCDTVPRLIERKSYQSSWSISLSRTVFDSTVVSALSR